MRLGEYCPHCGFEETYNWRARFLDVEADLIEYDHAPEQLRSMRPGETRLIEGDQWAYHRTKTGKWIIRKLAFLARVEGFTKRYRMGGAVGSEGRAQLLRKWLRARTPPKTTLDQVKEAA